MQRETQKGSKRQRHLRDTEGPERVRAIRERLVRQQRDISGRD